MAYSCLIQQLGIDFSIFLIKKNRIESLNLILYSCLRRNNDVFKKQKTHFKMKWVSKKFYLIKFTMPRMGQ